MKRVLVLEWSLSGQAREVTDQLVAPLQDAGHSIERRTLKLEEEFPFPWPPTVFFGIFPEVVLERPPPARSIELPEGPFDLIIASGSIWFLRPCSPWQAFLKGPQRHTLTGQQVLTLTVCRNMWVTGWGRWVTLLREAGAVVTDRITVTHSGPVFAGLFSTLFWAITGDRQVIKALPRVEINKDTLARVSDLGVTLAERLHTHEPGTALLDGVQTAEISHAHAFGERIIGATLFPKLARFYAAISTQGSTLRAALALFQMALTVWIVVFLGPPILLFHWAFSSRINPWVEKAAQL